MEGKLRKCGHAGCATYIVRLVSFDRVECVNQQRLTKWNKCGHTFNCTFAYMNEFHPVGLPLCSATKEIGNSAMQTFAIHAS